MSAQAVASPLAGVFLIIVDSTDTTNYSLLRISDLV